MKKFFLYLLSFSFFISVEPQSWRDPYDGITDIRILPMLKNLSKEHIGTNINPKDGRLLHDLIIKKGYKKGLEIGTSYGYSTLWLGLAFKQNNGKLITIEIDPEKAREAEKNFHHAGLNHIVDSRINDAFEELSKLQDDYDFIFIDGMKKDHTKFFHFLKYRLKRGGMIVARNEQENRWNLNDFLYAIKSDSSFKTTIEKGSRSGMLISIKKF